MEGAVVRGQPLGTLWARLRVWNLFQRRWESRWGLNMGGM